MTIPDCHALMLPLARRANDGKVHQMRVLIEALADELRLTLAEREEMIPSGPPTAN